MLCCASCNITCHLDLASNSLSGTLPSEVGLLTQLSESPFVWLLIVMSCCVFACIPMLFIFHSTAYLGLFNNSLTRLMGVIPSEIGSLSNLSESSNALFLLLVMQIVAMCSIMLAIIFIL